MKIRFTAKSEAADALYRQYLNTPAKQIKSVRVVQEEPLIIEIEPRLGMWVRKALDIQLSRRETKKAVIGEWTNKYAAAMDKEGIHWSEYDIEVRV